MYRGRNQRTYRGRYPRRRNGGRNGRRVFLRNAGLYRRFGGWQGTKKELKFKDIDLDVRPITGEGGGIVLLPSGQSTILQIPQGTGDNQRVGRYITVTKLSLRLIIELKEQINGILPHDQCRIVIFWDTQANGTAASLIEYLQDSDKTTSFKDLLRGTRFKAIYDKSYVFNANAFSTTGTLQSLKKTLRVQIYLNMRVNVVYSAALGAVTELTQNNLVVALISRHNRVEVSGKIRLRFKG